MKIREYRKKKHITQKELANLLGMDCSTISKYESGVIYPPLYRLQAIAKILDCEATDLYDEQESIQESSIEPTAYQRTIMLINPMVSEDSSEYDIPHTSLDSDLSVSNDSPFARMMKQQAAGKCDLCEIDVGEAFLDIHFIDGLSQGGMPIPENCIVLCPSCHKKIHIRRESIDFDYLRRKAELNAHQLIKKIV